MTTDIIFLPDPESNGGYYINRAEATVVCVGGYGRLEFELSDAEIAEMQQKDPDEKIWGDEADLVFPRVQPDWPTYLQRLPSISEEQLPATDYPWLYWCAVDANSHVIMQW